MNTGTIQRRDAASPLDRLHSLTHMCAAAASTLTVLLALFAVVQGAGLLGLKAAAACVTAPTGPVQFDGSGAALIGLKPGTTSYADSFNVCSSPHPSTAQAALSSLYFFPMALLVTVVLLLAARTLDSATVDGVYTARVARSMHVLAWVLLLGGFAAHAIEAASQLVLLNTLTHYRSGLGDATHFWSFPWATTLVALAAFAIARTVRTGARMHADLEGTV